MSSLRLLKEGEENDTEVTWEDQCNINSFSKLNARLEGLEDSIEAKKREKEYLDDLSNELELVDEDEPIKYRIGDAFVSLDHDQAMNQLSKDQEKIQNEVSVLGDKVDNVRSDMARLKALLYGKFGKSINLEKD